MPDPDPPFVSVVTPVYNGARFLERAADSLRRLIGARLHSVDVGVVKCARADLLDRR